MSRNPHTLDYSSVRKFRKRAHYWLNVALFCGTLPLVTGTLIIVAFLLTYMDFLELLGLLNIIAGLALFVVGCVSLLIYILILPDVPKEMRWRRRHGPWTAALLLVANFPVCWLFTNLAQTFPVTFVNQTNMMVDSITLTDPRGTIKTAGAIAPGGRRTIWILPDGEGSVTYVATTVSGELKGDAIGYVTSDTTGKPQTVVLTAPTLTTAPLSQKKP